MKLFGMIFYKYVIPEQIASWGSRVKHNLELVNKADKKQNAEKTKVMDTGDDFGNENIV